MNKEEYLEAFNKFNKSIYNFVYYRVGKNKEVAEDITQSTFLKAWKYREAYDTKKSKINTWLHQIASNLIKDYYRFNSKNESPIKNDMHVNEGNQVLSTEESLDVEVALEKLSHKDSELLVLKYINDLSYIEMAEILGSDPNTLKVSTYRALQKLKLIMSE